MPPVHELYELWAADTEPRNALERSLEPPRGSGGRFEAPAALCPTVYAWERRA